MSARPMFRRVGYSLSYEGIAVVCSTALLALLGNDPLTSIPLAIGMSALAIIWNLIWNTIFENLERHFGWKGRAVWVRMLHAIGFEGGLSLICIPLLAWWLDLTLVEAFFTEIGLLAFFLLYTYIFNFTFDKVFGLPESAK